MESHDSSPVELDGAARRAFLGEGGTGVLSLDTPEEAPPHAVPVSYGFDAETETFYFRLAVGPSHEKTPYLDRGVSFVVYDRDERTDRWQSVVASGRLEPVDEAPEGTAVLAALERSHIPLFDLFDRPTREVDFGFFRLVPETFHAVAEPTVRE